MLAGQKIGVIIPAYEEEKHVGAIIARVPDFVDDIMVVDDGSTDRTSEVAREAGARVIRHEVNKGKGKAVDTGIKNIIGDVVVFMDADGQHRPEHIKSLVAPILLDRADLVIGSRLLRGSEGMPFFRVFSNAFSSFFLRLRGVKVRDSQCGYRAIRKSILDRIKIVSTRYEIESEILIKAAAAGARITEVPIDIIYADEKSYFRGSDMLGFFKTLLNM